MKKQYSSDFKFFFLIIIGQLVLLSFIGCTTTQEPLKKARGTFMQMAETKRQAHLEVTVAMPSASEAEEIFGMPLSEKEIQPIWIRIKNYEGSPHMFLPLLVDHNYYPPYEVLYKFKHLENQNWYAEIKEKSIHHFIEPYGEISGYIFINLMHGTRRISVGIIGHGSLESFIFYIPDSGIELDYERVDFDHLYPAEDRIHINETNLRDALERLPCCTTNPKTSVN